MRQLFTAPTVALDTPPDGAWHAVICPGAPAWSLVVVDRWHTDSAELDWLARTNVTERYPEDLGRTVPTLMVTAFGPWGVVGTDTIREALRKIRIQWPVAHL